MNRFFVLQMTHGFLFIVIGLLWGCTVPLLPSLPSGLNGSQNRSLSASRLPAGGAAADAAAVCDRAAFEAGYKTQYARRWNWGIRDKEVFFRVKSQQNPGDAAARRNYALYRGKERSGQAAEAGVTEYGLKLDAKGRILNDCEARSFTEGEAAGMRAAGMDLQKLAGEEL